MSFSRDFDRDGERLRVQLRALGDDRYEATVGTRKYEVLARLMPDGRVRFEFGDRVFAAAAGSFGKGCVHVSLGDESFVLEAHGGRRPSHDGVGDDGIGRDGTITAPMTGTVLEIRVVEGEVVTADQTVAVVSAMKMEHKLLAGIDGTVTEIACSGGETVDQGGLILRIERAPS